MFFMTSSQRKKYKSSDLYVYIYRIIYMQYIKKKFLNNALEIKIICIFSYFRATNYWIVQRNKWEISLQ